MKFHFCRKSDISKILVYSQSMNGIWKRAGNVSPLIVLTCKNWNNEDTY